jgi:hypothetical protein
MHCIVSFILLFALTVQGTKRNQEEIFSIVPPEARTQLQTVAFES